MMKFHSMYPPLNVRIRLKKFKHDNVYFLDTCHKHFNSNSEFYVTSIPPVLNFFQFQFQHLSNHEPNHRFTLGIDVIPRE